MIDEGRDCNDVLTQFAAAHKAMSKAGFRFFAATMEQCRLHPDDAVAKARRCPIFENGGNIEIAEAIEM